MIPILRVQPASASGDDDYPTKWKDAPMDSMFDSWGEYNRECTSFVAWRLSSRNGFTMPFHDNASGWAADAKARNYAVNSTPVVGAVAWSSGHVAWVENVNADSSKVTLEEYNEVDSNGNSKYGDDGTYSERTASASAYAYIHFKDLSNKVSAADNNAVVATAAHMDGEQDTFWKGADNNLWEVWYQNGRRYGPVNLGMGALGSSPAAAVRSATGYEYIFWKGTDGNLWEAYYNGSWHGPIGLGMGALGSQPTATIWGNEINVFWKGLNGDLFEAVQDGTGSWVGPLELGMGALGSSPAAAAYTSGEQDVFWRGINGDLFEAWYSNGWHGPANLGMGPLNSAPTADIRPSNNEEDVFWKGTDGNLWEAYYNGSWHGPLTIGMGAVGSAPAATAWGGEVDVYWRGLTSGLFEAWSSEEWHGPANLGMGQIPSN